MDWSCQALIWFYPPESSTLPPLYRDACKTMKWIIEDLRRAREQLRHGHTWLVIGLIGVFTGLAYLVASYAFRTDSVLTFIRKNAGSCREMTNGLIIAMFSGMIFFGFSAVLTLGEIQRYFYARQRKVLAQARHALIWACVWGSIAISIAVSALVFFKLYCY